MHKIALIGGPGTDRSSPGGVLANALGLELISVGNLFRDHVQRRTPVGEQMEQYMRAGELVPDELAVGAIAEALAMTDVGWVLDGYPNTVGRAESLAQRGHEPGAVIELVLSEDEYGLVLRRRMELDPQVGERREALLLMRSRYKERVAPLRAYYEARGVFRTASGFGEPEDVVARLIETMSGH
jgi:adenylate kinase